MLLLELVSVLGISTLVTNQKELTALDKAWSNCEVVVSKNCGWGEVHRVVLVVVLSISSSIGSSIGIRISIRY